MTAHRVKIVVLDLEFPQGGFPAGLGGFLDQLVNGERVSEGPAQVTAGSTPAEQIEGTTDAAADLEDPPLEDAAPAPRRPAPTRPAAPARATPKVAKGRKPQPAGSDRSTRIEEIRRRLKAGEEPAAIAKDLGMATSTIVYHKQRLAEHRAAGSEKLYCKECGKWGYDPKRCDNCQERR